MKRLFWVTLVLFLVTLLLVHASAAGEETEQAEAARRFCVDLLAGNDEALGGQLDDAMRAAMTPQQTAQLRDSFRVTLGEVEQIGAAWFVDELQGYQRYRVPVTFENGLRDLLVAFAPEGKIGGLFTVAHEEPPAESAGTTEVTPQELRAVGRFVGNVEIPGAALAVTVQLEYDDGWSGTIDIPAQLAIGLRLNPISIQAAEMRFTIADVAGSPTFVGRLEEDRISGTLSQSGQSFPFTLERRTEPDAGPPQTPRPPFNYSEEEVSYRNGKITLTGTLTLPPGQGPFPAALLISGSGPQDRNGELLGHKPFWVIADHLTRAGIAVLRVDDRGVGGSTGNLNETTTSDLAEDALAAVGFLAGRKEIDPKKIGLIGHSEGGSIAPLAASRADAVAYVVLLAGPGVPGSEVMALQMGLHMRALGVGEEAIARVTTEHQKLTRLVIEGATIAAIGEQLGKLKAAQGDPSAATPEEVGQMLSPWMKFFLAYDPAPALSKVKVPVLALNGELDLQVDAAQNLDAIRAALSENDDVTARRMAQLNHLFQTAETGLFSEYAAIEETFAPQVLDLIRDWILERFASVPSAPAAD